MLFAMHEAPPIDLSELRACLRVDYALDASSLEFLPVGDTHSAIYRVDCWDAAYLLKLRPDALYEAAALAPRYLLENGVAEVIAPVPTASGPLWTTLGRWRALLFPFVAGTTGWSDMTDDHWRETGRIFRRIHTVAAPASMADLRSESFDPSAYGEALDSLDKQIAEASDDGEALRSVREAWHEYRATIAAEMSALTRLAPGLREKRLPRVICHADLHPGNLLRTDNGRVYVIDWDDVILAPKERDFIFTGEPGDPFFDGYGATEVDWEAVTYYRCERCVTDLIEYARDMFRDLGEETKRVSAERFRIGVTGRNFEAAQRAAERIGIKLR
jgi:spectinomycin phosphotransferase